MGMIARLMDLLFGGAAPVGLARELRQTVELFRENTEASAERDQAARAAALQQFAAEFQQPAKGRFDRLMDGINRLPRPGLALGTLALFIAAMVDPIWFAARMQGLALVPQPLWWLLGGIVSFYFGARHQVKAQDFQRDMRMTYARLPEVLDSLQALRSIQPSAPDPALLGLAASGDARQSAEALVPEANAALNAWRLSRQK